MHKHIDNKPTTRKIELVITFNGEKPFEEVDDNKIKDILAAALSEIMSPSESGMNFDIDNIYENVTYVIY